MLDAIIFLAGACLLAIPAIMGFYPGAIDTTVHVTLGSLICVCAVFRVLVAYGSAWLEIVLCVLGILTLLLPFSMHMRWDPHYNFLHLADGAVVVALSILSALMTFAQLRKIRPVA